MKPTPSIHPAPKPKPAPPKKPQFSSITDRRTYAQKLADAKKLRSTTPPRPKKKRSKSEQAAKLDREYGGEQRLAWLHEQACVACGHRIVIEAAHVISGGTSRKADARWTVPLCGPHFEARGLDAIYVEGCHRHLHRVGSKTFELHKNVDLKSAASRTEAAWQAYAFSKSEVG